MGSGFIARPSTAFGRSTVVFKGCNKISLDVKGRLTLPTRCRDGLVEADGNTVVVTIDLREVCLLMYPATAWAAVEAMLTALPNLDEHYRRMQRLVLGHATEVEVDGAGRVVFGATVELEEEASGDRVTYQIVGEDEADLKKGLINIGSPIARALIGKEAGDTAVVIAPGGEKVYEVMAVSYV